MWVVFWKWTAILKKIKTDLTREGNQSFFQSTRQNKSCQNLFRKNNRIEFTMHPGPARHLLEWPWQTATKALDMHHPLLPLVKSDAGGWLICLLWKGIAPSSTQCPWSSAPFIHLLTSERGEPLPETNKGIQLQNLICRRMLGNVFWTDSKTH